MKKQKIAIIGSGISGLSAAWLLSQNHDVTIFEKDDRFGGHANSVMVPNGGNPIAIDTGFIVCNDRNYANFLKLLEHLDITPYETDMSFAVSKDLERFEYAGSSDLTTMFAQKSNIMKLRFWKMLRSILRFYKETACLEKEEIAGLTLKDYLDQNNYPKSFLQDHILPMAAAIWSTPSSKVGDFPLVTFLKFCQNHGLLSLKDRPQWYTIRGGSQQYVKKLIEATDAKLISGAKISGIDLIDDNVQIEFEKEAPQNFDKVLIATHADTALALLKTPDQKESEILSRFSYAKNRAVLHRDKRFMPKRKKAWASWNYMGEDGETEQTLSLTYWMNRLQPLNTNEDYFVTLNPHFEPDPNLVEKEIIYEHPIFDLGSFDAQQKLVGLQGHRNIYYAGAHFGYGFHEDGVQSGLYAAELIGGAMRPWDFENMNDRIVGLDLSLINNNEVDHV